MERNSFIFNNLQWDTSDVDRITILDKGGAVVDVVELESLPSVECGQPRDGYYRLDWRCPFDVPVSVPEAGEYRVEVRAWQRAAGDEAAKLEIAGTSFEISAQSLVDAQTVGTSAKLAAGDQLVRLRFMNDYYRAASLYLGQLAIRDSDGGIVQSYTGDALEGNCGSKRESGEWRIIYWQDECSVNAPVTVPSDGSYRIELTARHEFAEEPPAELEIAVETDEGFSQTGGTAIRRKLVELHQELFGIVVPLDSPDVEAAYQLFLSVWDRRQMSGEGDRFLDGPNCKISGDHLFFEGIAEIDEEGDSRVNWDIARNLLWRNDEIDYEDRYHVARTWVVVLSYLLSDYRYLYL